MKFMLFACISVVLGVFEDEAGESIVRWVSKHWLNLEGELTKSVHI